MHWCSCAGSRVAVGAAGQAVPPATTRGVWSKRGTTTTFYRRLPRFLARDIVRRRRRPDYARPVVITQDLNLRAFGIGATPLRRHPNDRAVVCLAMSLQCVYAPLSNGLPPDLQFKLEDMPAGRRDTGRLPDGTPSSGRGALLQPILEPAPRRGRRAVPGGGVAVVHDTERKEEKEVLVGAAALPKRTTWHWCCTPAAPASKPKWYLDDGTSPRARSASRPRSGSMPKTVTTSAST